MRNYRSIGTSQSLLKALGSGKSQAVKEIVFTARVNVDDAEGAQIAKIEAPKSSIIAGFGKYDVWDGSYVIGYIASYNMALTIDSTTRTTNWIECKGGNLYYIVCTRGSFRAQATKTGSQIDYYIETSGHLLIPPDMTKFRVYFTSTANSKEENVYLQIEGVVLN